MKVVFTPGARDDLTEIRRYVVKRFGQAVWLNTLEKIHDCTTMMLDHPQCGLIPEELESVGLDQYRQVVSGMNRVIYEVGQQCILIHIICDVRRDFRTLLTRRLLQASR